MIKAPELADEDAEFLALNPNNFYARDVEEANTVAQRRGFFAAAFVPEEGRGRGRATCITREEWLMLSREGAQIVSSNKA